MKDFQTQSVLKAKIVVFLPVLFNPNIKFNDKARSKLHIRDVPYALNIAKIQSRCLRWSYIFFLGQVATGLYSLGMDILFQLASISVAMTTFFLKHHIGELARQKAGIHNQ